VSQFHLTFTPSLDKLTLPFLPSLPFSANLFVTQNARLQLERHGVVLYRDSSANKGGVTSSSMEVLAGMSLNDAQFLELMCSPPGEGQLRLYFIDRH